jgi:hypothetical protein
MVRPLAAAFERYGQRPVDLRFGFFIVHALQTRKPPERDSRRSVAPCCHEARGRRRLPQVRPVAMIDGKGTALEVYKIARSLQKSRLEGRRVETT